MGFKVFTFRGGGVAWETVPLPGRRHHLVWVRETKGRSQEWAEEDEEKKRDMEKLEMHMEEEGKPVQRFRNARRGRGTHSVAGFLVLALVCCLPLAARGNCAEKTSPA